MVNFSSNLYGQAKDQTGRWILNGENCIESGRNKFGFAMNLKLRGALSLLYGISILSVSGFMIGRRVETIRVG